ncbi:ATP-dependent RNA helicase DDX51-like [Amphiura filiformis]|uniref:ATP-dependent RNA helicase DDX51-like n=1 Tax=Amphiura filiformis TaxID=82378 RepID=UPI003B218517
MALFHVNRYMGTEDSSDTKASNDSLLQKLHDKAKAREKQRAERTLNTTIPSTKSKKLRKTLDQGSPEIEKITTDSKLNQSSTRKNESKDVNFNQIKAKNTKESKKRRKHEVDSPNEDCDQKSSVVVKVKRKKHDKEPGNQELERTNTEHNDHKTSDDHVEGPVKSTPKLKKKRKEKQKQNDDSIHMDSPDTNRRASTSEDNSMQTKSSKKDKKKKKGKQKVQKNETSAADLADEMEVDDLEKSSEVGEAEAEEEEQDVDVDGDETKQSSSLEEEKVDGDKDDDEEETMEEEENVGFTVLGEVEEKSRKKVLRVLPEWLSQPTIVEHDLTHNQVAVDDYALISPKIASALKQNDITHLFPVQRHVIPIILDSVRFGLHSGNAGYRPRDLCVSAPTGSGKTLAFAVPIVQALHDRVVPRIRALAVLPTRDLANQVYRVFAMLCNAVNLRAVLLGGQKSFDKEQEIFTKHSNSEGIQIDIVVATPGRLVDHINNTKGFTLQYLRFLVIDEADRMMEAISKDWISQVEKSAYPGKYSPFGIASLVQARPKPGPVTLASCSQLQQPLQKLLFSATLSQNPEKLTHLNLFQPRLVTTLVNKGQQRRSKGQQQVTEGEQEEKGEFVGKYTTPVGLTEFYIQCSKADKPLVVLHLTKHLHCRQVLCFTNTVEATHRLYLLVKIVGGVNVAEFSSNLKTAERQQILKQFKAGKIDLLICSDAMARGMDMDNVRFVISYGLPPYLNTYIHRVGRTARAGKPGIAFSLLQKSEVPMFKSMLKNAGKTSIEKHTVKPGDLQPLMMDYEDALDQLPHILKKENMKS